MKKDEITVPQPSDALLQKNLFSLLYSGNALIIFAVWTLIRSIIQQYFYQAGPGAQGALFAELPAALVIALAVLVLALSAVDLILKLFVGFSARAEGLGKHRKNTFIVLGIILVVLTILWLVGQFPLIPYYYHSDGLLRVIISLAVEVTVLFAELDVVLSAIRVRKLENVAAAQDEGSERGR